MKIFLGIIMLFLFSCSAGVEPGPYPQIMFPSDSLYKNGFGVTADIDDAQGKLQKIYESWLSDYYVEDGDLARIKFDNPRYTVSEGIAYGMLIMVYMDNNENQTKYKFDKLLNYWNKYTDSYGFMHWKIDGFGDINSRYSATDADMDFIVALIMAYKQWGDESYLDLAKEKIDKFWKRDIDEDFITSGDTWYYPVNPSYFSFAALKLFSQVTGDDKWERVIAKSYKLLEKAENSETGLVPDWCDTNGVADKPNDAAKTYNKYGYDAVRINWRLAWEYAWYGDNLSKAHLEKLNSFFKNKFPDDIVDGYNLDGTEYGSTKNVTFLGAAALTGIALDDQDWINSAGNKLFDFTTSKDGYYGTTLRILYQLLISGKFQNLWVR